MQRLRRVQPNAQHAQAVARRDQLLAYSAALAYAADDELAALAHRVRDQPGGGGEARLRLGRRGVDVVNVCEGVALGGQDVQAVKDGGGGAGTVGRGGNASARVGLL